MIDIDLCALGAAALSTRDLVAVLLRHRPADVELGAAERALSLVGPAREAALLSHRHGPQLLAALELGRRAWMLPSPAGRRVRAPVDVAAVVAPRAEVGGAMFALALDVRLTLAHLATVSREPADVMRAALAAGCTRVVLAERRPHAAVPTSDDEDFADRLRRAGATVGVRVVDVVLLGDDGFCSLLRLGLLRSAEPRYR